VYDARSDWSGLRARLLLKQDTRARRMDRRSQARCNDCRGLTGGESMGIWKRACMDEACGHGCC